MPSPKISEVIDLTMARREIREGQTIAEAVKAMKDVNYNCLLVKNDDGIAVGILSEHDIVRAFAEEGDGARTAVVGNFMEVDISVANESDTLDKLIKQMAEENLRYIPIVSDAGYVTSFVSIMELLTAKIATCGPCP